MSRGKRMRFYARVRAGRPWAILKRWAREPLPDDRPGYTEPDLCFVGHNGASLPRWRNR